MGFFSWKTSCNKATIWNNNTDRCKPVYLLERNGQPNIKEPSYDGYGVFGGVNVHDWLARNNAHLLPHIDLDTASEAEIHMIGIGMDVGNVYRDTQTQTLWHVFHDSRALVPGKHFAGRFDEVIPELGQSANDLIENGRLERLDIKDVLMERGEFYPLKFSFDPNARYEALPASEACPNQGYFGWGDDLDEALSDEGMETEEPVSTLVILEDDTAKAACTSAVGHRCDKDTIVIHGVFRATSANFDLGGAIEPDYVACSVSRQQLADWIRLCHFLQTDSAAPDYIHLSMEILEFYCCADSDSDDDSPELWVKELPLDVLEFDINTLPNGQEIYKMACEEVPDIESQIEEVVISRRGHVFVSGADNGHTWEVDLGCIQQWIELFSEPVGSFG